MSVPARHGGTEVGENPYENADIEQALSILDSRMQMLLDTRRVIRDFRDSHDDTDRRMALSMAAAVITDGPLIASHIRSEQIATHDHSLALQMQSAENARRPMTLTARHLPPAGEIEPDRDQMIFLARLAGRYISPAACEMLLPSDILANEQQAGNSSSLTASHECVICGESKYWHETLLMPCGDEQCAGCLQELFSGSYKDESLFPPKCCRQVISINKHLRLFISPALLAPYANREIELSTTDRTYCHECQAFILPDTVGPSLAVCAECGAETCPKCKGAFHPGACPIDHETQLVLEMAVDRDWQRCYKCLNMVSISTGCNHMK
jgi:hypothetical protein